MRTTRRTFLTGSVAVLATPLGVETQQAAKAPIIGILTAGIQPHGFREGLQALGYIDGKNITILQRASGGQNERFPELVAELLRLGVDVMVSSATPAVTAAKQATKTVPIVMAV